MILKPLTGTLLCFLLLRISLPAQEKTEDHSNEKCNVKFGKVSPEDFNLSTYKFDSGASAVVIADIGDSHMEGNNKGTFSVIFKHSKRTKILNKSGYEAAQEEISLYTEGNTVEELEGLKAVTYNLENGKVVESTLDSKSVFTDKINKNLVRKKFSFPAVKEGSIIELSYTIRSEFFQTIQPWTFQGEYPRLWSEYNVSIPEYFHYAILTQGYQNFYISNHKEGFFNGEVRIPGGAERDELLNLKGKTTDYHWVIKDVPPLKDESFTTTIRNHVQRMEFQLSRLTFPDIPSKDIMGNWFTLSERLMKSEYFGEAISKNNGWMDNEINPIIKGANNDIEKARKVYAYIRDNFTCTDHEALYAETPIKTVFKNKNGTVSELNLLLTAMLNHLHIEADPVILGTRENGYTSEIYPILSRFNYVVCQAKIDSSLYYLDASQTWMGFGHLPEYCYNGHARLISKDHPHPVYFFADSLKEKKTTLVFISNDEKGQISGGLQSVHGDMESSYIREKIKKKGEKDYFKDIQTAYPPEILISNTSVDSLKIPEEPVKVSYDFLYKPVAEEGLIYFNPMLGEGYKTNPFKSSERSYPVEMPYAQDELYILNMAVPNGYMIDEIPKSTKVLFNDDEGFFEYLINIDGQNIQLRCHIKLNKAVFEPTDYQTLRDFYAFIVKKQSEQIVFKKKN